jgi:hypothetical protein
MLIPFLEGPAQSRHAEITFSVHYPIQKCWYHLLGHKPFHTYKNHLFLPTWHKLAKSANVWTSTHVSNAETNDSTTTHAIHALTNVLATMQVKHADTNCVLPVRMPCRHTETNSLTTIHAKHVKSNVIYHDTFQSCWNKCFDHHKCQPCWIHRFFIMTHFSHGETNVMTRAQDFSPGLTKNQPRINSGLT